MLKGLRLTLISTVTLLFLSLSYCSAETIKLVIENSPYLIKKDLIIKKHQTLAIEPNVVIEMAKDTSIIIEGRVEISGYPKGGGVIFKAEGPYPNYHKGFWKGVVIKSKQKNVINYAIVQHAKVGIEVQADSSLNITNNIITQNKTGVKLTDCQNVSISRNSFLSNFTDIDLENSGGKVVNNFFQGSLLCLKLKEGYSRIEDNFFKQVYKGIIESDNEKNLTLSKNWWGSADKDEIAAMILQQGDGAVIFEPFLEQAPDLSTVGVDLKE
jgi:parallel beta-helix repeat protein